MDDKGLPDVRKVQIVIEFGGGPDFADFDPAVIGRVAADKIRVLTVFKVQFDVLKKSGLVVLDGEVIMGFTVTDQIVGDLALGQQGIGGNILTLDIDGIQQRDGCLDFIGALDFFMSLYRQGAYFFWV